MLCHDHEGFTVCPDCKAFSIMKSLVQAPCPGITFATAGSFAPHSGRLNRRSRYRRHLPLFSGSVAHFVTVKTCPAGRNAASWCLHDIVGQNTPYNGCSGPRSWMRPPGTTSGSSSQATRSRCLRQSRKTGGYGPRSRALLKQPLVVRSLTAGTLRFIFRRRLTVCADFRS